VVRDAPNFVAAEPGAKHWALLERLARATGSTGALVSDVYLAALALELDAELITADQGFSRFPRLRYRNPVLDG
jgi:predicted nucleic acid-binding protein